MTSSFDQFVSAEGVGQMAFRDMAPEETTGLEMIRQAIQKSPDPRILCDPLWAIVERRIPASQISSGVRGLLLNAGFLERNAKGTKYVPGQDAVRTLLRRNWFSLLEPTITMLPVSGKSVAYPTSAGSGGGIS